MNADRTPAKAAGKPGAKAKPVVCSVARRDHASDPARTEVFEVDIAREATLHELLEAIARDPRPRGGVRGSPPAWDAHCLEGSCGGCAIRAGGRAVLACVTRIDEVVAKRGIVVLEPLGVVPVVRDLVVDHAPRDRDVDAMTISPLAPEQGAMRPTRPTPERASLGACIACGACLDACPEAQLGGGFVGAEAIVKNRRVHAHPGASVAERASLDAALLVSGGIAECGHAQNCIDVCPTGVPIAEALADASRAVAFPWRGPRPRR